MLTPQEVAQRSFTKASFGGYNMAMVDDFLDELTADYESLFNENALLKQKLGVLSGKMREYQSTEEAMRKTLLAAQEMSDKMVKDTEAQCAQMLAEAESQSEATRRQIHQDISSEEQKLAAARQSLEDYKTQVRAACQRQLDYLEQLDTLLPQPEDTHAAQMEATVEEIQAAVERSVAQEQVGRRLAEPESSAPAPEDTGDTLSASEGVPEPAPEALPRRAAPSSPVDESSISLYEELMARRKGEAPQSDPTEPSQRKNLEFGKDFTIE